MREIYQVTFVGLVVNLLLSAAKLVAGIIGRSAAMTADAVHSFSGPGHGCRGNRLRPDLVEAQG